MYDHNKTHTVRNNIQIDIFLSFEQQKQNTQAAATVTAAAAVQNSWRFGSHFWWKQRTTHKIRNRCVRASISVNTLNTEQFFSTYKNISILLSTFVLFLHLQYANVYTVEICFSISLWQFPVHLRFCTGIGLAVAKKCEKVRCVQVTWMSKLFEMTAGGRATQKSYQCTRASEWESEPISNANISIPVKIPIHISVNIGFCMIFHCVLFKKEAIIWQFFVLSSKHRFIFFSSVVVVHFTMRCAQCFAKHWNLSPVNMTNVYCLINLAIAFLHCNIYTLSYGILLFESLALLILIFADAICFRVHDLFCSVATQQTYRMATAIKCEMCATPKIKKTHTHTTHRRRKLIAERLTVTSMPDKHHQTANTITSLPVNVS